MAPSAPPLTREEFVSLRDGAKGLMHRIPSEHKARLIELGYIEEVFGGIRLTSAGRMRDCGRLTDLKWPKSYFQCTICGGGPWQMSDSKTVVVTFRTSQSIALQMSALKIIGRCVCCPQAPLMPTRPPVRHSTSKASCDATTI